MPPRTGARNKNNAFLMTRLKAMYGESFDPVMKAAALAHKIDTMIQESESEANKVESPAERLEMQQKNVGLMLQGIDKWLKMAEFTNGKIQSVQLTGDADNPVALTKIGSKMPEFEAAKIYRDTLKAPH